MTVQTRMMTKKSMWKQLRGNDGRKKAVLAGIQNASQGIQNASLCSAKALFAAPLQRRCTATKLRNEAAVKLSGAPLLLTECVFLHISQ
jgi:hypothetical protein